MWTRRLLGCGLAIWLGACASPPTRTGNAHDAAGASGQRLSVLTLNLQTFAVQPNVEERTAMVIDLIRTRRPDVIALQEVAESAQVENRAEVIGAATSYEAVWTGTERDESADYHGGPAVLSRWPLASQQIADLPHLDFAGEVQRRAIRVTAVTPLGEVVLVGTHTTTDPVPEKKADQAVAGAALLLASMGEMPGFYAGDFNAEPGSLPMRALRGENDYGELGAVFDDAWASANPGEPGHTYPSRNPSTRLDYVFTTPGSQKAARARGCERVLGEPEDGGYASDHLGVLCEFSLAPSD